MSTDRISEYLAQFSQVRTQMLDQIRQAIVGQAEVIEQILAAVFTRGHCLLVGVPGLAKTLIVSSISQILDEHPEAAKWVYQDLVSHEGRQVSEQRGRGGMTGEQVLRMIVGKAARRVQL